MNLAKTTSKIFFVALTCAAEEKAVKFRQKMNQGINVIGALRVNLSRKEVREFLAQKELKENVQQMPSAVKMPATGKNIRNHLTKQQQPKKTMHRKQITENNSHSNRDPVDKVQSKYVPDKAVLGKKQQMRINLLNFLF